MYDTYHDGEIEDIAFLQLLYCKAAGHYSGLRDFWRYTVLRRKRPETFSRSEASALLAKLAAAMLTDQVGFIKAVEKDT